MVCYNFCGLKRLTFSLILGFWTLSIVRNSITINECYTPSPEPYRGLHSVLLNEHPMEEWFEQLIQIFYLFMLRKIFISKIINHLFQCRKFLYAEISCHHNINRLGPIAWSQHPKYENISINRSLWNQLEIRINTEFW
jgi:hypothetical protein